MFDDASVGHYTTLTAISTSGGTSGLNVSDNLIANGLTLVTNKTNQSPAIWATGSDTNISLVFVPKGTGVIQATKVLQVIDGGSTYMNTTSTGLNLGSGEAFSIGVVPGLTCSPGTPSSSFATVGGIVTHC